MTVKERVLRARLSERIEENPKYAETIGVSAAIRKTSQEKAEKSRHPVRRDVKKK